MKLSILIPALQSRVQKTFAALLAELQFQITEAGANREVEIIWDNRDGVTIGEKRNHLLNKSIGEYVAFIDDDDEVYDYYISELLKGIETNPDCISLHGIMTTDGKNPEHFEHSIQYNAWRTTNNQIKYERTINHLNCIKSSIAKQFKFPEISFGEDHAWSKLLHESGLLKKEYYIGAVLYHYRYISKK